WQDSQQVLRVGDVDTGEERFAAPFRTREHFAVVASSPDGNRLLAAEGDTVSIWAVGAELLQSTLAAATSACLAPQIRRQNLGESETEAHQTFEACERQHGRR
ncbi:MAG TPA: hypothetical protein VN811_05770, partial [Thermoanaerobaculia bacterium]|nr:hypothetical protein [Thermoanaerobaculia bacterium]